MSPGRCHRRATNGRNRRQGASSLNTAGALLLDCCLTIADSKIGGAMTSETRLLRPPILVFTICFWVVIIGGLVARVGGLRLLPLDLIFVGFAIGFVCHELGHVLFAAIGSIPIRLIQIGLGPLLWRSRFGETWLELRA